MALSRKYKKYYRVPKKALTGLSLYLAVFSCSSAFVAVINHAAVHVYLMTSLLLSSSLFVMKTQKFLR